MRSKTLVGILLTLILVRPVWSLPKAEFKPAPPELEQEESAKKSVEELNVIATPAPPVPQGMAPAVPRYLFLRSLATRIGFVFDSAESGEILNSIGIQYLFPNRRRDEIVDKNWEIGLDMIFNGDPLVSGLYRWTFKPKEHLRYVVKAGGGVAWVAEEQFAALANFENYYGQGAVGIEKTAYHSIGLKGELDVAIGMRNLLAILSIGAIYAW